MTSRRMAERPQEEIWELTVPGRVNLTIHDHLGKPRHLTAKGVGQRLRLSEEDRLIIQERIRQPQHDVFVNGMLVRVDSGASAEEASPDQLTDEELESLFGLRVEEFKDAVAGLGEVPVRRLYVMAEAAGASVLQVNHLKEQIETRWPVTSGDTPTYREMMSTP